MPTDFLCRMLKDLKGYVSHIHARYKLIPNLVCGYILGVAECRILFLDHLTSWGHGVSCFSSGSL